MFDGGEAGLQKEQFTRGLPKEYGGEGGRNVCVNAQSSLVRVAKREGVEERTRVFGLLFIQKTATGARTPSARQRHRKTV